MKKQQQILFLGVVFIAGIIFVFVMNKNSREELINAPKIRKELILEDIHVNTISFERNGLYLNGVQYNSGGISGYSKFHFRDSIFSLDDINPPFILKKDSNNDTLKIIKDDKVFYLLISEELIFDELD